MDLRPIGKAQTCACRAGPQAASDMIEAPGTYVLER
jgi:hypothetical protein